MLTLSPDTTTESERLLIQLMRQAPPWRKLNLMAQMNESLRILAKLEWYQKGGGVSDLQWLDLPGILNIQGDRLDRQT